jgi:hypothetical protein
MASIRKQKAGAWRVQVRRKGPSVSENFVRYEDAKRWAVDAERQIDRGETPISSRIEGLQTFGDLVDLHIDDMCEVGKAPGRSKHATLQMLKRKLVRRKMIEIDRECVVEFGRSRAKQRAGSTTIGIDVEVIKLVMHTLRRFMACPCSSNPSTAGSR